MEWMEAFAESRDPQNDVTIYLIESPAKKKVDLHIDQLNFTKGLLGLPVSS